jgi:hypothetical protein
MGYQQSFKNFHQLKNFVRPWADCYIFFFFYSETEFQVEIYGVDLTVEQQDKIDKNRYGKNPYGVMNFDESGEETLFYKDEKINIEYGLFSETFLQVGFRDPIDMQALRSQFLMLVEMLKNK